MQRPGAIVPTALVPLLLCGFIASTGFAGDTVPYLSRAEIDQARLEMGLPSLDAAFDAVSVAPALGTTGGTRVGKAPTTPLPYLDGPVYAMVEYEGDLIIAGEFTRARALDINGDPTDIAHVNNIARWDGSHMNYMGSGMNGPVYALATVEDRNASVWFLLAGGEFTRAGGQDAENMAAWDGERWEGGTTPSKPITAAITVPALDHHDPDFIVLGTFEGLLRANVYDYQPTAKTTNILVQPLVPTPVNESILALAYDGTDRVLAAGHFTTVSLNPTDHVGAVRNIHTTPQFEELQSGVDGPIFATAWDDVGGRFVAGGTFSALSDQQPAPHLAYCDEFACGEFPDDTPNGPVFALLASGGYLWVGGAFSQVGPMSARNVAYYHAYGWHTILSGVTAGSPFPAVYAIAEYGTQVFFGGNFDNFIFVADQPTASAQGSTSPNAPVHIEAVTPNPFNPRTLIEYSVPADGPVRLTVHDVRGRTIATLVDEIKSQGTHDVLWNSHDDGGRIVASGTYIIRVAATGTVATQKVALLR